MLRSGLQDYNEIARYSKLLRLEIEWGGIAKSLDGRDLQMKAFSKFVFGVFVVALLLAIAGARVQFKPWTRPGQEEEYQQFLATLEKMKDSSSTDGLQSFAKVVCDQPEFNFGRLPPFAEMSRTFVLRNEGNAPLILTGGKSTCLCTQSDLVTTEVAPGAEHEVTLTWFTRQNDKQFHQSAKILTNDPEQPELMLSVLGEVETFIAVHPGRLDFPQLVPDRESAQDITIFSDILDSFTIDRIETTGVVTRTETLDNVVAFSSSASQYSSALSMRVHCGSPGDGHVRLYVRPSEEWLAKVDAFPTESRPSVGPDGTILLELPVFGASLKRLGLYSPIIKDGDNRIIDLGKHRVKNSSNLQFTIVGKIRGEQQPSEISVELSGIPGLTAEVERGPVDFKIHIRSEDTLNPGLYDQFSPGNLVISAPGLADNERTEFQVYLIVLSNDA